jgi:hypothetical protein
MKKASWIRRHTAKLSILLILQSLYRANAFVTPSPYEQRHGSFVPARRPQSQLNVMEFQWDELVYNAESAASSFASQSLENPTALWSSLPVMYGAGLLTSVSPCVWGLLPLTMSYISSSASERADKQATLPTLAFAAGLASVFCTLGLIASSMGGVFGANSGGASDILVPLFFEHCLFGNGTPIARLGEPSASQSFDTIFTNK